MSLAARQEDREVLWKRLEAQLCAASSAPAVLKSGLSCEWLPGDASNRFYARLKTPSQSFILMVMNAPEAFKSEEKTGGRETSLSDLPFVSIGKSLESHGIRVPHLAYVDPGSEFLVLEDLGSELLYDRRQKEGALAWYQKALIELAAFQKIKAFEPAASRSFTEELLTWEAEHFVEYAVLKNNKKASEGVIQQLRKFHGTMVQKILKSPYVLCHRDYHSKNLMILEGEGRIGVIDFQDALLGPADYDLASLLRDSYVTFTDEEEAQLLSFYETASGRKVDRHLFGLVSLQRNLKAVGRFFYIHQVKGKDTHLPYVVPTLRRIVRTLKGMQELQYLSLIEGLFSNELKN